jgi:hypothetical protein
LNKDFPPKIWAAGASVALFFPSLFKVNAMKNANKLIALLTSSIFVAVPFAQPESDIATPAERSKISQDVPDLGQKQKEDWQRLREERKQARQQILLDIKANAHAEIKDIQQDINLQKTSNNAINTFKGNENIINSREDLIRPGKDPRENAPAEWEKQHPENPPFDVPRPNEHIPFPKGPKF